jgi:2-polyprenyl-3-methyl-5-hydroxy-6-metoxy-1,4-benzoquinol methylase
MDSTSLVQDFASRVVDANPIHASFMRRSLKSMRDDTRKELTDYLNYGLSLGLDLDYLALCYNTIVNDLRGEQIFFTEHGRFRWSRFADLANEVYFNAEYMRKYMYGLAITSFLWPNHVALHDFFVRTFPRDRTGIYLEIGPGHGYYFMQAAQLGKFDRLIGVDISEASVALTRDIVRHFGIDQRSKVEIEQKDFFTFTNVGDAYSCIVMGEVLEHVEEPGRFVAKLAELSRPETHVFLTTCMNAAAIDHISLFRTGKEVEDILTANGFDIVESEYVPYLGKTLDECEEKSLPINVAYVLKKS